MTPAGADLVDDGYGTTASGRSADDDVRGGQAKTVEARNGQIRSSDAADVFIVAATDVGTVADSDGVLDDHIIIVEGTTEL